MKRRAQIRWTPVLLLLASIVGLFASFVLLVDSFKLAQDASYVPSCNINPIFNCISVMGSEQAQMFGLPNPIFGVVGFMALLTTSVLLLFGVILPQRIWLMMHLASVVGVVFVHYLIFESLFVLRTICPWCFIVWLVVMVVFMAVTRHNATCGYLVVARYGWTTRVQAWLAQNSSFMFAFWVLLLFLLIGWQFRDSWGMVL